MHHPAARHSFTLYFYIYLHLLMPLLSKPLGSAVNFISEAFSAPKCHPFSISARSRMSWLYFRFIKLLAHAHVLSDDLGCFRKVAKRFDEFPRRSFVHGWSLYVGSFKSSVKKV